MRGTKAKPQVFMVEEAPPWRVRTDGSAWPGRNAAGVCAGWLVVEVRAGRRAGGKDVVTWSSSLIPSCLCWQLKGEERHLCLWAAWPEPGCLLSQGSAGPSCL